MIYKNSQILFLRYHILEFNYTTEGLLFGTSKEFFLKRHNNLERFFDTNINHINTLEKFLCDVKYSQLP
jgi:hypothetical protein